MRRVFNCATVLSLAVSLALSACASAPGGGKCKWGVCIDLELSEPIRMNELVPITITVETEENIQGLKVSLWFSDPDVLVDGEGVWVVDAEAHTPMQFSTTIRFTEEGYYSIHAGALGPRRDMIDDVEDVRMTTLGGTLNPPPEREPGTPELLEETVEPTYLTPSSPLPTPSSPLPTPLDSSLPDVLLEEQVAAKKSWGVLSRQAQGGWKWFFEEKFEGLFPSTGWTVKDLSWDGYDRKWDDDDYKPYRGYWAAWPANGGADGIYPAPGDDDYPDNMNTRMIAGPFDLGDAVVLATGFWLWREIQADYDYLAFEISHDGIAFQELARWSDDKKEWEQQWIYCYECGGDDSVWVAWRFYSDSSVTKDGPWVDDIALWKYVPGQVTAQGSFHYYDRDDDQAPARYTRVYLYDADSSGGDDLLGSTTTEDDGSWEIGPLTNWDEDEPSPDGRLDLYAVFETDVKDGDTTSRRVTDFDGWAYEWQIPTKDNVDDGMADLGAWSIEEGSNWEPAMWIFQDLRRAWEYVHDNTGTDPGPATARWEENENSLFPCDGSCCWPYPPISGIFIEHNRREAPDIVIHELGHLYMYNAVGTWWWPNVGDMLACLDHSIPDSSNDLCAWSEGWADFHALAINGDECFDWNNTPCSGRNIETPTWGTPDWDWGDEVEGRVAGALYDLFDQANDGRDQRSFGFSPIWNIIRTEPGEKDFLEFWDSWVDQGYNAHGAVQAIFQNTIDYDMPPTINLPDRTVLQGCGWNNAIDLWTFSSDMESDNWELEWRISQVTDSRCGVSIDVWHFVDINPSPDWLGSCDVTIVVSDSIKTAEDTFTIDVVPVVGRAYLPLVLKNHPPLASFATIVLDAPQPDGDNGWYVSDVEVSFTVPPGTVLPRIEYRLNLGDWYTFTAPFTITTEGENLVQIRPAQAVQGPFGLATHRVRLAGSTGEEILSFVVKIDQSLPTLAITTPQPITYTHGATFTLDYQAADAYSDLAVITATLDTQPVTNGQVIDTLALGHGAHEFALAARDGAGHTTSQTVAFTVTTTLSGLIDLKHRLYAEGGIYGPGAHGIVQSLDAKLEAAQRNLEAGLPHAAINNLQAFIHEVEAQTGKHITPDAAKLMIEDAQRIIASLSE